MGSKAARKIPKVLVEYLEDKHGEEFADWYVKQANRGKRQVTAERQQMSAEVGKTGAYHEGHFRGAEDIDPKLGGGPTTGLTMRPEIAEVNIAHKEMPRIDYDAMVQAGVPQNWVTDVYETVLESEGLGVIGSYDTTAALDMDAGMDPGQAQAQTDRRRQLRAQGVEVVGPETKVEFEPFKGKIQSNPDVSFPDFAGGLETERAIEKQQIAARRSNRFKKGVTKVAKGVARFVPGSLDDVALGTGFGGIAAGAAFVTGGDPAQAFGDVVSDVATSELQVGELFDESQDFGEALKQSREQNARPLMDRLDEGALGDAGRAIKRGGRLSFEFGGVKLTLPEYGYSELLGFN